MAGRGALVLAGGRARRFQVRGEPWMDKALAPLGGKPLLIHSPSCTLLGQTGDGLLCLKATITSGLIGILGIFNRVSSVDWRSGSSTG